MTTQIAVRLSDDLVAYIDALVGEGAGSRAAVVTRALNLYQQQRRGELDALILEQSGDYEEFDTLVEHLSIDD